MMTRPIKLSQLLIDPEPSIKPDIKVHPRGNDDSDETVIEVSLPTMTEQIRNVIW